MEDLRNDSSRDPFLIIGLGNPGSQYAETRHNAGFWFLDQLASSVSAQARLQKKLQVEVARVSIADRDVLLARPTTFMNQSGWPVQAVASYYRVAPENLLIAYDELDLPPGVARLKIDGGHGGHNGLRDVMRHLGHGNFKRLRIGIGHPGIREAVTPWVLSRPTALQASLIESAINRAMEAVPMVLDGDMAKAMKHLHTEKNSNQDQV